MKFYEALDLDLKANELVSFVGGGGKTTALFMLAKELKACEKRVLVTTTTAIYAPDENHCDEVVLDRADNRDSMTKRINPCICVLGREITPENKLLGADKDYITHLFVEEVFDYLLVEADGSRQRSIKAPADHEPVIPNGTTKVVGVIGLDILGTQIDGASVHRPECFCRVTGRTMGERIDKAAVKKLILEPEGLFKTVPEGTSKYVLFNKADNRDREKLAMGVINEMRTAVFSSLNFIISDMLAGRINKVL
jgi:probable selenium-dependent hydroxylase accessory protein YqeC